MSELTGKLLFDHEQRLITAASTHSYVLANRGAAPDTVLEDTSGADGDISWGFTEGVELSAPNADDVAELGDIQTRGNRAAIAQHIMFQFDGARTGDAAMLGNMRLDGNGNRLGVGLDLINEEFFVDETTVPVDFSQVGEDRIAHLWTFQNIDPQETHFVFATRIDAIHEIVPERAASTVNRFAVLHNTSINLRLPAYSWGPVLPIDI